MDSTTKPIRQLRILRKVRKEFDYQSYVETHFSIKYASNGEYRVCCPNCGDYKYKLYVNDEKKKFNCFKCSLNTGNYDVFDFVAITEGISRGSAMLRLAHEYAEIAASWEDTIKSCVPVEVEENDEGFGPPIKSIDKLPAAAIPLTDPENDDEKPFWRYLRVSRGLSISEVIAIKTHYIPNLHYLVFDEKGKKRGDIGRRILIPVYGGNHQLVSWISRSIDGVEPKYFNCPNSENHRTLWPYIPSKTSTVVLVEGIFDALAVRRLGFDAYATFGKKLSKDQINLLKTWSITSIIFFWDKEAINEMVNEIEKLKLHFSVQNLYVTDFSQWPKNIDAGDTMIWEEDFNEMKNMLTSKLIPVDSWDYVIWKAS